MTGTLYRHLVYPAYHWIKRDGVNRARRELEQNQWRSTSEILALQQEKLARLLAFATRNVPYYRRVIEDFDLRTGDLATPVGLRRLPPLTKAIIRREKDALLSEDLTDNGLIANSTSGSTGEAIRFYTDLRSTAYRKAAAMRSDQWTGWRLGERHASIWGSPIDQKITQGVRGALHARITGSLFLSSFNLSSQMMDSFIDRMRRFKPVMLLAYPGPLEQFAIHCQKRGATFPSLRGIVSSAETLWPHQREVAEQAFGVTVFNRYGSREVGQIGSECDAQTGIHISADRLLVEVVDGEGQPVQPGEAGRMLVTDLDNYGMPLIRYDIGDRGVPTEQQECRCGRGLPMLANVEGRTLEVVRTPDGRQIGGTFWTLLLRSRPGFDQFQVVQRSIDGVEIRFVANIELSRKSFDFFTLKIRENCGEEFGVDFVETDAIDLTVSGKQRVIVSELDQP